jgi:hypothetical protein
MSTTTDIVQSNSLADLAHRIRAEHEASGTAIKRGLHHAMAAGDLLLEAKKQIKHGQWLPWLKKQCEIPERTASHYMRLARKRSKIGNVADLTVKRAVEMLREQSDQEIYARSFWAIHEHATREIERGWTMAHEYEANPTEELAEKITEHMQIGLHRLWLLGGHCVKLEEPERLGMTENEWWENQFALAKLGDGEAGRVIRDVIQAYRNDPIDIDECIGLA